MIERDHTEDGGTRSITVNSGVIQIPGLILNSIDNLFPHGDLLIKNAT